MTRFQTRRMPLALGSVLLVALATALACKGEELGPEARQVKVDLEDLRAAVSRYVAVHQGQAPESLDQLIDPEGREHGYLTRETLPVDPWQRPYLYTPPAEGEPYNIRTLGRDGMVGGRAQDTDIDLNMLRGNRI